MSDETTTRPCPTCDGWACSCAKEDAEVERILTMPDADLLDEALAAGIDVHEVAERGRALFASILARHNHEGADDAR